MDGLKHFDIKNSDIEKFKFMFTLIDNDSMTGYGDFNGGFIWCDTDINLEPKHTIPFKIMDLYKYRRLIEIMFHNNEEANNVYIWRLEKQTNNLEEHMCIDISREEWEAVIYL